MATPLEESAAISSWTNEDVRAFLRSYGRAPANLHVEQLDSWWFNLVLRVEADGEHLVLRRYGVTPPEDVRWELAVLDHLRKHDFPTLAPLMRCDAADDALGDFLGKPAVLYPFIEGRQGRDLDWSLALAQTAEAVARLHELTAGLAVPHPRVNSGTESRRSIQKLLDFALRRGVAAHESALRDLLRRAESALEDFQERVAPFAPELPCGVVHHDAHADNAPFRDGRLVALIDFDDAYEGYLVADVASMITNWAADGGLGDPLNLQKAVTVVREYERPRKLTSAECELLPDFMLLYLLSDTAQQVSGALERGAHANTCVDECNVYKCYLHHAHDADWLRVLRKELGSESSSASSR